MPQSAPAGNRIGDADDGFFIPDLCAPQAVFLAVLLAELMVLLHVLALGPIPAFDWQTFATGSLFVQWNTLLCIALICSLRARLRLLSLALAASLCLLVVGCVTVLSTVLAAQVYPVAPADVGSGLGATLVRNAVLAVILAAIVLRYSYLQQRVAMQQRSELQLRLDALRARIRPHFLFNTLNSIASLITIQPERAERAIEDVSELFRAALRAEEHEGSLAEELHLCRLYLDLETLRLGERLTVTWDVEEGLDACPLPSLLLQPLVENAVYHGIAPRPEGGEVRVQARREGTMLVIEVLNPLPPGTARPHTGGQHMAQENVRQRIEALYPQRGSFQARPEGEHYRATLRMPLPGGGA
jgi:two-component system sensor histidine kinase AlgZ